MAIGVTLFAVVAIGGELLYLHHERSKPMVGAEPATAAAKTDPDDLVFLKNKRPSSHGRHQRSLRHRPSGSPPAARWTTTPPPRTMPTTRIPPARCSGPSPSPSRMRSSRSRPSRPPSASPAAIARCCSLHPAQIRRPRRRSTPSRSATSRAGLHLLHRRDLLLR